MMEAKVVAVAKANAQGKRFDTIAAVEGNFSEAKHAVASAGLDERQLRVVDIARYREPGAEPPSEADRPEGP